MTNKRYYYTDPLEWKSIESAPIDGYTNKETGNLERMIIGFCHCSIYPGYLVGPTFFHSGRWRGETFSFDNQPTHWLLLFDLPNLHTNHGDKV